MMLGMSLSAFTTFHVVLSLIGILTGFVVVFGLIAGRQLRGWTGLFLSTTLATSLTGFLFPFHGFGPPHYVGMLSLVALALAALGRYSYHLAGRWRRVYVISSVVALYFNVFVAIVQAFQKVPALHAIAPKQNEPPFAITQIAVLILFVTLGKMAGKRFGQEPLAATSA
jgi:hypothetical protein